MDAVDVQGLRIAFRRAGTGPPLVLLHGALGDSRVWRDQLADLSDTFTVIAWDAPGCGGSSDPPGSFRLTDYADCLAGFADALRLARPSVLGHSFGGGLALSLYQRRPDLPAALILAGGYAGWAGSLPPDEVAQRLRVARQAADEMERNRFRPATIPGLFSDAMPPDRADELAAVMADARPACTRTMALAFAEADLRDLLPGIRVPTLLIYGDADQRAPRAVADQLHAAIPGSRLVMLPGLGHEAYLESAESFNAEIRRFLLA